MQRTLIKDLNKEIGKDASISGWVDVRRDHGKLVFLVIRDRSGTVQVVVTPKAESALKAAEHLRDEWVVTIQGEVKARPDNMKKDEQNGELELSASAIEVLSEAQELPFEKDTEDLNIETYLDNMPLTLRSKKSREIFAIYATAIEAFRKTLRENGFTEFQAPAIVGGDAEGGAGVFKVEYFKDRTAYLATSPQLYKQIMVGVFERVFTTTKVFRAEKHATSRHLAEYTTTDFEMGFIKDHTDIMAMLEHLIKAIVQTVTDKHDIEAPQMPEKFPVMKLREAQEIITKETGQDCTDEPDLEPAHERFLCEYAKREFNSDFIFITHYPVKKRPFYTYEDEEDKGFTKSFDLLFRGIEITTGGQRIHDYNKLLENIKEWGLEPKSFEFYLQAFKSGLPPHGGIGMGIERFVSRLLNLDNVRSATLFPRDMNRIDLSLAKLEDKEE